MGCDGMSPNLYIPGAKPGGVGAHPPPPFLDKESYKNKRKKIKDKP